MSNKKINIFISHSWYYSAHYDEILQWVIKNKHSKNNMSLDLIDCSVPKEDPLHRSPTSKKLKEAIFDKISESDIILMPTGMYSACSDWIQKEIDAAKECNKPILVVSPWAKEQKNSVVKEVATKISDWDEKSIIDAIVELA